MRPALIAAILIAAVQPSLLQGIALAQPFPTTRAINPAHERAKNDAQAAHAKGDFSKAIELTSTVLRTNPNDDVALYLRASSRVELGQATGEAKLVRDGIADARQAISASQSRKTTYFLPYLHGMTTLATTESRPEHAEVALKVADQALSRPNLSKEDRANLHYQRANIRMVLQDVKGAIEDHQQAIQAEPRHFGSRVSLAHAYAAAGNQEKALESFGQLVEAFPESAQAYNDRGSFLMGLGRLDEAIVEFTRTVEIDPRFVVGYINRGYAFFSQSDTEAAQNDFTAAIKIDPNNATAFTMRGDAQLVQGRVSEALADYNRSVELQPRNPGFLANVGFAKFVSRDYRGALVAYNSALAIDPNAQHLNAWRVWSQVVLGQTAAARQQHADTLKKPAEQRTWFDQLILHALEASTNEQLLASVDSKNEEFRSAQLCEAYYFIGLKNALDGKIPAATENFRQSVATKKSQLYSYRAANLALGSK